MATPGGDPHTTEKDNEELIAEHEISDSPVCGCCAMCTPSQKASHKKIATNPELLEHTIANAEGYVWKRGWFFHQWGKRYARVVSNRLVLYKLRTKDRLGNFSVIPLTEATVQVASNVSSKKGPVISLSLPGKRTIFLAIPLVSGQVEKWVYEMEKKPAPRVSLANFRVVKKLGTGAYGEVQLVEKLPEKQVYALKKVAKITKELDNFVDDPELAELKVSRHLHHLLEERSVLQMLNHPYIVKLHYAFQEEDAWYLVQEFCDAGDMYSRLGAQPQHRFNEDVVRIWAAQLVSALEHIHEKDCVHRDLKLENVLLDRQGHVRLCDFGFAKLLKPFTKRKGGREKAYTFCGTKYYLAPEMLHGDHSHDNSVDWWGLGILIYELLFGRPPFTHKDRHKIYEMILHDPVKFPSNKPISNEARDFIEQLLIKDPINRLGYRVASHVSHSVPVHRYQQGGRTVRSFMSFLQTQQKSEVRCHPFFRNIDWNQIDQKKVKVPISLGALKPEEGSGDDDKKKAEDKTGPDVERAKNNNYWQQFLKRSHDRLRLDAFSYVAEEHLEKSQPVLDESIPEEKERMSERPSLSEAVRIKVTPTVIPPTVNEKPVPRATVAAKLQAMREEPLKIPGQEEKSAASKKVAPSPMHRFQSRPPKAPSTGELRVRTRSHPHLLLPGVEEPTDEEIATYRGRSTSGESKFIVPSIASRALPGMPQSVVVGPHGNAVSSGELALPDIDPHLSRDANTTNNNNSTTTTINNRELARPPAAINKLENAFAPPQPNGHTLNGAKGSLRRPAAPASAAHRDLV